jgi:RNA polymerase sigma-B factor
LLRDAAVSHDDASRRATLDRVVALNMRVAESIAARYRNRGVPQEDLTQVAYVGLVKAAHGFDPAGDHDFLSYAVPTIRGEVRRYFRDRAWSVRPPRRVQEMQARISAANEALWQTLGRSPRPSEVADHLGVEEEEVVEALAANGCFTPTSLDMPLSETESAVLGDVLPDEDGSVGAAEARAVLSSALTCLSDRDRRILYLRFFRQRTQSEIAAEIGVTQMQVSRLLTRILDDLRCAIGSQEAPWTA